MSAATQNEVAVLCKELDAIKAENEQLHAELRAVKEENKDLSERVTLLLRERAEDRQRIAELEAYRADNEHDKATIRQQVTKVEDESADEPSESDAASQRGPSSPASTPMEQLLRAGEAGVLGKVTASVERATAIAEHFARWASKTPTGLVIKDDLKNLLETATGENLAWNQVYRAARALEKFTKGQVRFEKHRRHGWMLIAEPQVVTALSRASSASER